MTTTPVAIRIHESLDLAFASKRLVFCYDTAGECADVFDSYAGKDLQKLRVEGNEFASKVLISRSPIQQHFLLYLPKEKPEEKNNWLLDLLLAGREFKADRASLDILDVGLRRAPGPFRGHQCKPALGWMRSLSLSTTSPSPRI
jgi:hypothetical protein